MHATDRTVAYRNAAFLAGLVKPPAKGRTPYCTVSSLAKSFPRRLDPT
jgi:hypothetical protein